VLQRGHPPRGRLNQIGSYAAGVQRTQGRDRFGVDIDRR
jgi:hypothetical protein